MGYVQDEKHFLRLLNKALRENPREYDPDSLLPAKFYLDNVYAHGLADELTWHVKCNGPRVLEERELLEWLRDMKPSSVIADSIFNHTLKPEFINLCDDLQHVPGVYSFWNRDNDCLYVGMSTKLGRRLPTSFRRFNSYDRGVYVKTIVTDTATDAAILELYFIWAMTPIMNAGSKYEDECTLQISPMPEWSELILCNVVMELEQ